MSSGFGNSGNATEGPSGRKRPSAGNTRRPSNTYSYSHACSFPSGLSGTSDAFHFGVCRVGPTQTRKVINDLPAAKMGGTVRRRFLRGNGSAVFSSRAAVLFLRSHPCLRGWMSLCPSLGSFMPSQLLEKTILRGTGGRKNKTWKRRKKKLRCALIKKLPTFSIMNRINF